MPTEVPDANVCAVILAPAPAPDIPLATPRVKESESVKPKNLVIPLADVETDIKKEQPQAIFTVSPYDFHPRGLAMIEYAGSYNGKIIEWRDPITSSKIFEWDEDFKNGPHYHAFLIEWDGKHYKANDLVPEPWNTIYFGG